MERIYEGKAKVLYRLPDSDEIVQRFKDSATAFNGKKYAEIDGKGELNNLIASTIFRFLAAEGLPSHYVATLNSRDMRVKSVTIVPLEVVVRNIVAGSLAGRLGMPEGRSLDRPVIELYYKSDELGDPMINDDHVAVLGAATPAELTEIRRLATEVNNHLRPLWAKCGLELIDFKLEFGRTKNGTILLADEISPDTSRLWDVETRQRMDKDVFRRDLADLRETYAEVWRRLSAALPQHVPQNLAPAPAAK